MGAGCTELPSFRVQGTSPKHFRWATMNQAHWGSVQIWWVSYLNQELNFLQNEGKIQACFPPHTQTANLFSTFTVCLVLVLVYLAVLMFSRQCGLQTNHIIHAHFWKCSALSKTRLRLMANRALLRKDADLLCSFAQSSADADCISEH